MFHNNSLVYWSMLDSNLKIIVKHPLRVPDSSTVGEAPADAMMFDNVYIAMGCAQHPVLGDKRT